MSIVTRVIDSTYSVYCRVAEKLGNPRPRQKLNLIRMMNSDWGKIELICLSKGIPIEITLVNNNDTYFTIYTYRPVLTGEEALYAKKLTPKLVKNILKLKDREVFIRPNTILLQKG